MQLLLNIVLHLHLCWHWSSFPSECQIGWAFRATWNSQQSREIRRQIVQILVLCECVFLYTLSCIQKAIFPNAAVGFLEEIMKTNERNRLQIHCVFHAACSSLRSEKPNLPVSQSGFALGCFLHGSPGDLSQSEGLGREVDTHTHMLHKNWVPLTTWLPLLVIWSKVKVYSCYSWFRSFEIHSSFISWFLCNVDVCPHPQHAVSVQRMLWCLW